MIFNYAITIPFLLMFIALGILMFRYDIYEKIGQLLPSVKPPERVLSVDERIIWTGIVILLYFILGGVTPIGYDTNSHLSKELEFLSMVFAIKLDSLLATGIGPIIIAYIFVQLFVGSGIIPIKITDPVGKARYTTIAKGFAVVMCFIEALLWIFGHRIPVIPGYELIVAIQIALGSILLLYFDDLCNKYGIYSALSLFIAANVSERLIHQFIAVIGALFSYYTAQQFTLMLLPIIKITVTVAIFVLVCILESMYVLIPIVRDYRAGASSQGFPLRLMYVSNIPVIFAAAMFSLLTFIGAITGLHGLTIFFTMPGYAHEYKTYDFETMMKNILEGHIDMSYIGLTILHMAIYTIGMIGLAIIFGLMWIEVAGQGSSALAEMLTSVNIYVQGMRRSKEFIKRVLDAYIPYLTLLQKQQVN
jgi:preprotein translocase subunit SecY